VSGQPIDRREALQRLATICMVVASGPMIAPQSSAQAGRHAVEGLASLFRKRPSIALLGAAFVSLHPEEGDIDSLAEGLGLSLDTLPMPGSPELETAAASIRSRHIDDFRQQRLFEVGGWNLSHTELRLAAVVLRAQSA
jgi:hypothetical protein